MHQFVEPLGMQTLMQDGGRCTQASVFMDAVAGKSIIERDGVAKDNYPRLDDQELGQAMN